MDRKSVPYSLRQKHAGTRELFSFSDETSTKTYFPIRRRQNGTYRIDHSTTTTPTGFFKHTCPDCKERGLLFVHHFDGGTNTLTYLGVQHIDDSYRAFKTILPSLRSLAGFRANEAIIVYKDVHKDLVHVIDPKQTLIHSEIEHGDILVVQRSNDKPHYVYAHKSLPSFPSPTTSPTKPLQKHAQKLWETRQNADVTIRYGLSASLSLKCHNFVLSISAYFNNVFNNPSFLAVSETTLDAVHDTEAVELIIEYMYLGDSSNLTKSSTELKVAMIRLADFLNLEEVLMLLVESMNPRSVQRESVCFILREGLECTQARKLADLAVDWIYRNMEVLHEEGPLKGFLRENGDAYDLVMEAISSRVKTLKRKFGDR
ncbi:hypothetical protein HK097_009610 [Rhizophlyctis rosea]|uniref:BTB domain-containing protein n=1 Tax=Rhizophlyctis rosea TaxID=64517 RepID=A0AAD5X3P4_9FUNG|nr:hypothetical protein HK097_009610 [Rhizophlyctis rosea]